MDLSAVVKAAIDLGVIPALALFLVVAMHRQNRELTKMLADRETQSNEMIRNLVAEVILFAKSTTGAPK